MGSASILGVLPAIGGSLADLQRTGQLSRFLDYYVPAYLERFERVRFFSYEPETTSSLVAGSSLSERLEVVAPRRPVNRRLHALRFARAPLRAALEECDLVRVLQAPGAVPAAAVRVRYVCTYGYSYSAFVEARVPAAVRPVAVPLKRLALRGLLRVVLRRAAAAIVTTPATKSEAARLGARVVWDIPNGVDVELFAPREGEKAYDVAFVGQLVARKDVATLVAALGRLGRRPSLALVGEGPEQPALARACREAGIDAEFLGSIDNRALPDVLARARCFVLPSRAEGHPKALLEAMAAGLACVTSDLPELADLGALGAVASFRVGNADELSDRLAEILGDAGLAGRLGRRAREVAEERFDLRRLLRTESELLAGLAAPS